MLYEEITKYNDEVSQKIQNINNNLTFSHPQCTQLKMAYQHMEDIVNFQEDIEGLVRVYIKFNPVINPTRADIYNYDIDTTNLIIKQNWQKSYGPFFGIFHTTNIDLFIGEKTQIPTEDKTLLEGIRKNDDFHINDTKQLSTDFTKLQNLQNENKIKLNGLFKSFEQAANGYSIILFGYGLSGSGKTYTLLGEQDEKNTNLYHNGNIIYGLEYLSQQGCTIELAQVFEQYYDDNFRTNDDKSKDKKRETGKIQFKKLFDQYKINDTKIRDKYTPTAKIATKNAELKMNFLFCRLYKYYCISDLENQFNHFVTSKFDTSYIYQEDINLNIDYSINDNNLKFSKVKLTNIFKAIDNERVRQKRVKETINNKKSSRSHLYIIFKIQNESQTGYVTVVDMGGRENPYEIAKSYFKDPKQITGESFFQDNKYSDVHIIHQYDNNGHNKPKITYDEFKIIFEEGYFLNETINHLIYFLKKSMVSAKYKF